MFQPLRSMGIPLSGRSTALPTAPGVQMAQAQQPVALGHRPPPCSRATELRTKERIKNGRKEEEKVKKEEEDEEDEEDEEEEEEEAWRWLEEKASPSCSTLQENFLKQKLELSDFLGSVESQESWKKGQGQRPQAGAPGTCAAPVCALKRHCKRKAPTLELPLPPPGPPQLQWDRGDMPPPPKISRTDQGKGLDSRRATKGQAIRSSDDKVEVL